LSPLASTGRGRATSILTLGVLKAQNKNHVHKRNQKLLSFVDARQDAALQSGYFNDYMSTVRLRSAIYQALKKAPEQTLRYDVIADKVFAELGVTEKDYAKNPGPVDAIFPDKRNEEAFLEFLQVRIFEDLRRSWRYTVPNLEQCALLTIDYTNLDKLVTHDEVFADIPVLAKQNQDARRDILLQVLNYLRTATAISFDKFSDSAKRHAVENRLDNSISPDAFWSFGREEKLPVPPMMTVESVKSTKNGPQFESVGPASALGKYLKRLWIKENGVQESLNQAQTKVLIEKILHLLARAQILTETDTKGKEGDVIGYQLRIDSVLWTLGDKKTVLHDKAREHTIRDIEQKPNSYYQQLYEEDFHDYPKNYLASEHTGQNRNDDRQKREKDFRSGEISALYCSPTMELGIDISSLDVVHMRNVPPTPANYAQRSGRAGRSGRAALVLTYCANSSPHDRHYYENPEGMVAGIVAPPRIDLVNEELLETHLNALMLSKLSLEELKDSLQDVVDVGLPNYPLRVELTKKMSQFIADNGDAWTQDFMSILQTIEPRLNQTRWFNHDWVHSRVHGFT
ncbi:MAG: helicase-related protein, partial [Abditibacteriaceae bacterium]